MSQLRQKPVSLAKIGPTLIKSPERLSPLFDRFTTEVSCPKLPVMTVDFSEREERYRYDREKAVCLIPQRHRGRIETINEMVKNCLVPFLLDHDCGFLFHASFLVGPDSAVLLTGVSGVGKSTLTKKLASFFRCGNDDLTLVRPQEDHIDAHSTPFCNWQKAKDGELPFPLSAQVSQVVLLEKELSQRSSVQPLHDKDAVWRYLIDNQQVFFPKWTKRTAKILHRYLHLFVERGNFSLLRHNLNDPAERIYDLISTAH